MKRLVLLFLFIVQPCLALPPDMDFLRDFRQALSQLQPAQTMTSWKGLAESLMARHEMELEQFAAWSHIPLPKLQVLLSRNYSALDAQVLLVRAVILTEKDEGLLKFVENNKFYNALEHERCAEFRDLFLMARLKDDMQSVGEVKGVLPPGSLRSPGAYWDLTNSEIAHYLRAIFAHSPITPEFLEFKTGFALSWIKNFSVSGQTEPMSLKAGAAATRTLAVIIGEFVFEMPRNPTQPLIREFNLWRSNQHPKQLEADLLQRDIQLISVQREAIDQLSRVFNMTAASILRIAGMEESIPNMSRIQRIRLRQAIHSDHLDWAQTEALKQWVADAVVEGVATLAEGDLKLVPDVVNSAGHKVARADSLLIQSLLDQKAVTLDELISSLGRTVSSPVLIRAHRFGFRSGDCSNYLRRTTNEFGAHWSIAAHNRLVELIEKLKTAGRFKAKT